MSAEDAGFYDGIISIELKEDGKLVATKGCKELPQCSFDYIVEHSKAGTHRYSAAAKDRSGNIRIESISVKFKGATPFPVLTLDENPYAEEGKLLALNTRAEDFNHNTLTLKATGLPRGAAFFNNVLRWTPDFRQAGAYFITFSATDSKGQRTSKVMRISVLDSNRAPKVTVVDPTQRNFVMNEDSSTRFTLNIDDPDEKKPTVEWILDGKIVSNSNPFLYKTNFNDAGNHLLLARVKDGDFLQRFEWNITVNNVNRPPKINDVRDMSIKEGYNISLTFGASDPDMGNKDNDAIYFEALEMPYGAKFDPDKGTFKWYARKPGLYTVQFKATDRYGYSASKSFDITVREKTEKEKLEDMYRVFLANEEAKKKNTAAQEAERKRLESMHRNDRQEQPRKNQTFSAQGICEPGYLCYSIRLK
jgi:hypothetical protein